MRGQCKPWALLRNSRIPCLYQLESNKAPAMTELDLQPRRNLRKMRMSGICIYRLIGFGSCGRKCLGHKES